MYSVSSDGHLSFLLICILLSERLEHVPLEVDAYAPQCNSTSSFRNARALLRQYLEEIGYSQEILDVRSFRAKNLLGLMSNSDWPVADSNRYLVVCPGVLTRCI
ncbi:unnamed protein product [Gongylonema pulchrum]|uniref:Peptidase_M14 domain-containing protein n=1 Tax=Gongylonema pulchrum TaxID=637853 RepID=A0A183EZ92_9BILA|nr:unnamed protein product [Gongylonema pulchrum]